MVGVSHERFAPHASVTRAMVAQVFYNRYGRPSVAGLHNPFYDVVEGRWYADAIIWAYHNGLISGFGDGSFRPDNHITRAHLVILFNNYADTLGLYMPALREYHGFTDSADVRSYARESIVRFYQAMMIHGRPGGRFDPQENVARAELAAMLYRFLSVAQEV